jgi:hypothetical protein
LLEYNCVERRGSRAVLSQMEDYFIKNMEG